MYKKTRDQIKSDPLFYLLLRKRTNSYPTKAEFVCHLAHSANFLLHPQQLCWSVFQITRMEFYVTIA